MPMSPKERRRVKICQQAQALISGGKTVAETSRILEIPLGTLERWRRKYLADGVDGLRDNYVAVGRPAVADCLPPDFADFIRRKAAKCGSMALAYQFCVDDPACPEELREFLVPKLVGEKPLSLPPSLRRVAKVTSELAAALRGPRALGHIGFKSRHSDLVIDPVTGQERKLLAGDIYLSDDMSTNHPFWFNLPDGERETRAGRGDKLAEKHGVAIGRQGLYTIDARGKWLGCDLIGRPTDAYTSADILRHFRRIIADWGMPRIGWILEKGVWLARAIDGEIKVVIDDGAREAVVAGLSSLGFAVIHVSTSEGKALIEGAFAHLQAVLDLLEIPTIGRVRGEMERVEKVIRRVQTGVIHPAEAGIPYIGEHIKNIQKAMVFCNGKPKFGRIQNGVPDEVWSQDTEAHPLRRLTPEQMGVFMPLKYETRIRQGCVDKQLDGVFIGLPLRSLRGLAQGIGWRLHLIRAMPRQGRRFTTWKRAAETLTAIRLGSGFAMRSMRRNCRFTDTRTRFARATRGERRIGGRSRLHTLARACLGGMLGGRWSAATPADAWNGLSKFTGRPGLPKRTRQPDTAALARR